MPQFDVEYLIISHERGIDIARADTYIFIAVYRLYSQSFCEGRLAGLARLASKVVASKLFAPFAKGAPRFSTQITSRFVASSTREWRPFFLVSFEIDVCISSEELAHVFDVSHSMTCNSARKRGEWNFANSRRRHLGPRRRPLFARETGRSSSKETRRRPRPHALSSAQRDVDRSRAMRNESAKNGLRGKMSTIIVRKLERGAS